MGKDMDGTGKKDHKPKIKKIRTAGSGGVRLSVVGGGKENAAADTLSREKPSAAAGKKAAEGKAEKAGTKTAALAEKSATERKKTAKKNLSQKNMSKKKSASEAPAEKDEKKDTVKREDIKEDIKKEEIKKEGTKEEAKEGAKEEKAGNKKETEKELKKGTKSEAKTAAKKTEKKKTKKRTKKASKKKEFQKGESGQDATPQDTSKRGASKENTSEKNISEKKPAAQQKEQTGKKAETKKAAGKSAAKTVSKTIGKAAPKKKQSGSAKSRNPNLRLVKNEEFEPVKKRSWKKEPRGETYADKSYQDYGDKLYQGGAGIVEWFFQHRSLFIIGLTAFAVVAALVWGYYYIVTNYRVTTVYVDGNIHYSNEEIMDMVMTGAYGNNSLYLAMKYKDKGVEGVPFVERMDVSILTPNTIRINVYEKALAGYVEYLGRYMYFDRDGIVVESSLERTDSIPQVTGLEFGYVVLNEALPVENDAIFKRILSITQLLDKYELTADRIYFNSDYDLTLYFDGVRVTLGSSEEIDEKVMRLQYILPELAGKTGTLSMENYTEDTKSIPFRQD